MTINDLSQEVKAHLTDYLASIGRIVNRNGTFQCVFESNHSHHDSTPSASLTLQPDGTELWYCHVCARGGTIYDMVSALEGRSIAGRDFIDITIELATKLGIPFNIDEMPEVSEDQKDFYAARQIYTEIANFLSLYGEGKKYLTNGDFGRSYTNEEADTILSFVTTGCVDSDALYTHLVTTFDEKSVVRLPIVNSTHNSVNPYLFSKNRLTFVVKDINGNVTSFVSRVKVGCEEGPKYFNIATMNKKMVLFPIDYAAEHIRKQNKAYTVEGLFDAISMILHGHKNTVATFGLLTHEQVKRLIGLKAAVIVHVPDGDKAGRTATYKALTSTSLLDTYIKAIYLGEGEDADSYLRSGKQLPEPIDGVEFCLRYYDDFHNNEFPDEKRYLSMVRFIAQAPKILAKIPDYAKIIQQYHGYNQEFIIKDIEQNELNPFSTAYQEAQLWRKIEQAKTMPISDKIQILEQSTIKLRDIAATSTRINVTDLTWSKYMSLLDPSSIIARRFMTGNRRLDSYCSLEAGELVFISGWPSHGKSAIIRSLVDDIVIHNKNTHCLYISADDNHVNVMFSFISMATRLNKTTLKEYYRTNQKELAALLNNHTETVKELFSSYFTIVSLSECHSISQIEHYLLRLQEAHKDKDIVVVVDALNDLSDVDYEDRVYGIESSVRKLKHIASSSNSLFAVISHLTKQDGKVNTRPTVSKLKGSSFIEYAAKVVILVHMDAHVNNDSKLQWYNGKEMLPIIELNIAKDKDMKANQMDYFKFDPYIAKTIEVDDTEYTHYSKLRKEAITGIGDYGDDEPTVV